MEKIWGQVAHWVHAFPHEELEDGCFSNEDYQGPNPSTVAMLHQLCGTVYSQFRISLLRTVLVLCDND